MNDARLKDPASFALKWVSEAVHHVLLAEELLSGCMLSGLLSVKPATFHIISAAPTFPPYSCASNAQEQLAKQTLLGHF